jgi:hypothetical protein
MSTFIRRPAVSWPGFVFAALMAASGVGNAQGSGPWTVAVTTVSPLGIGACSAVGLVMKDTVTHDRARGANGNYVQPGDFDIRVTAVDSMSVVEQRIDRDHTVACSCQGAKVGTVGTVTATYPARSLAAASRVPGVAFSKTTTFKVGKRIGGSNPVECVAAAEKVAAAKAAAKAKAAAAKKKAVAGSTVAPAGTVAPAPKKKSP